MARTLLFLIHGVGMRAPANSTDPAADAAATWWRDPVDAVLQLAATYAPGKDIGLAPGPNGVRIVPLSYCDVIIRRLAEWQQVGDSDVAAAVAAGFPGIPAQYLDELRDISHDDSGVFWTKAVDVLLYRVFFDVEIRQHVRAQIAQAVAAEASGGELPAVAFIAHSLGTAVLHDTLAELFLDPQQFGGLSNLDVLAYASLANVSKVLQSTVNPHESPVRPFGAPGIGRAKARRFVNARHRFDPIPYIGMFRPSWSPATTTYRPAELVRITEINTHSYVGYLRDPRVWGPMFEAVLDRPLPPAALAALVQQHEQAPLPPCGTALSALQAEVTDLATAIEALNPATAWQAVTAITKAMRLLDEAKTACAAEAGGI